MGHYLQGSITFARDELGKKATSVCACLVVAFCITDNSLLLSFHPSYRWGERHQVLGLFVCAYLVHACPVEEFSNHLAINF